MTFIFKIYPEDEAGRLVPDLFLYFFKKLAYNKSKLYEDYWPRDIWFFKKNVLYSINWPNFIVWLPLLFEILVNMCIPIVHFPDCDVIDFEINHTF